MDQNRCVLCEDETRGEFTCNQCQQAFCWEHRLSIQQQMNNLVDKCHHFKHDWNNDEHQKELFHQIDQWEKDSIENIKKTADLARNDLQELIQKSKEYHEQSFQKNIRRY